MAEPKNLGELLAQLEAEQRELAAAPPPLEEDEELMDEAFPQSFPTMAERAAERGKGLPMTPEQKRAAGEDVVRSRARGIPTVPGYAPAGEILAPGVEAEDLPSGAFFPRTEAELEAEVSKEERDPLDVFYGSLEPWLENQETPFPGWQEQSTAWRYPEVRSRLVQAGVLSKDQIDDPNAVYQAERESVVAPRLSAAATVAQTQRRLSQEARGVNLAVRRAQAKMGLVQLAGHRGGKVGISYPKMYNTLMDELEKQELVSMGVSVGTASPEQLEKAEKRARVDARDQMYKILMAGRGIVWIDAAGEDITESIMEWHWTLRPFAALFAPMEYYDPDVQGLPWGPDLSRQEFRKENWFSSFGRIVGSTIVGAIAGGAPEWGSQEQIEYIRGGGDIIQEALSGNLAKFLEYGAADPEYQARREAAREKLNDRLVASGQYTPEDIDRWTEDYSRSEESYRVRFGLAVAIPLIFLEPDPISITAGGVGYISKFARAKKAISEARRIHRVGLKAIARHEKVGGDFNDVFKTMERENAAFGQMFRIIHGSELGIDNAVGGELNRISAAIDGLDKKADALRLQADEAATVERAAEFQAQAVALEAQRAEAAWVKSTTAAKRADINLQQEMEVAGMKPSRFRAKGGQIKWRKTEASSAQKKAQQQADRALKAARRERRGFEQDNARVIERQQKALIDLNLYLRGQRLPQMGEALKIPDPLAGQVIEGIAREVRATPAGTHLVYKIEDEFGKFHSLQVQKPKKGGGIVKLTPEEAVVVNTKWATLKESRSNPWKAARNGLADYDAKVKALEVLGKRFANKQPFYKRITQLGTLRKKVVTAEKAYKIAAKSANVEARTLEKARKKWERLDPAVSKAVDEYQAAVDMGERFTRVTHQVLDSLGAYIRQFEKNFGGFKSVNRSVEEIKAGGMTIDHQRVKDFTGRVFPRVFTKKTERGAEGLEVDPDKVALVVRRELGAMLRAQDRGERKGAFLLRKFTPEEITKRDRILDEFFETREGMPLKWLFGKEGWAEAGEAGRRPADIFEAARLPPKEIISMQGAQGARLAQAIEDLARFAEVKRIDDPALTYGRAIVLALRDLDIGSEIRHGKSIRRHIFDMGRTYKRSGVMFNHFKNRIGEYSGEVEDIVRGYDNRISLGLEELVNLTSRQGMVAPDNTAIIEFMQYSNIGQTEARFMTGAFGIKKTYTRFNLSVGGGSIWDLTKTQMRNEARLVPGMFETSVAQAAKKTKAARATLAGLKNQIKEDKISEFLDFAKQNELEGFDLSVDDIVGTMEQALNRLDEAALEMLERGEGGAAIRAMSKVWTPSFPAIQLSADAEKILMGVALGLIETPGITFPTFMTRMRQATSSIVGDVERSGTRAYVKSAAAGILSSSLGHAARQFERVLGSHIDWEVAADMNRIISGDLKDVVDVERALKGFEALGHPATAQFHYKVESVLRSAAEINTQLIRVATSGEGGSAFMPRHFLDDFEAQLQRVENVAKPFASPSKWATIAGKGVNALRWYNGAWRGSVVTGYGIPNPTYWSNNMFADPMQMALEEGMLTGTRLGFQNSFSNIPFFGRAMHDRILMTADNVGKGEDFLPPVASALFNPHLGRIFKGEQGWFMTKSGRPINYDDVRVWAVDDDIMSTHVGEEVFNIMERAGKFMSAQGAPLQTVRWWNTQIGDHANLVQQRQRMAYYCHLLQQGVPRREAKAKVLRALYDWRHGLSQWEVNTTIARMAPFYRFWRLALRQVHGAFMEPFVAPTGEFMAKAVRGRTALAGLRQQSFIMPYVPEMTQALMEGETGQDQLNEWQEMEELGRWLYPGYMQNRLKAMVPPMKPADREFFLDKTGQHYSHYAITMPTVTAYDSLAMYRAVFLNQLAMIPAAMAAIKDGKEYSAYFSPDFEAQSFEPMLGAINPLAEFATRSMLSNIGADLSYQQRSGMRNLSRSEEDLFRMSPFLRNAIHDNPQTGKPQVETGLYLLFKLTPVLATQAPRWLEGFYSNPQWQEGYLAGTAMLTRKMTGIARPVPFDPAREARSKIYAQQREFYKRPTKGSLEVPDE